MAIGKFYVELTGDRVSGGQGTLINSDLCKNVFPSASSVTPLCAPNLRPAGTSFQRKEG